jgi:hypothetical protein
VYKAYPLAMKAITAVKNTVAPIPAYLFRSPLEQVAKISVSAPEQKIKKRCNMIVFSLIDRVLERDLR